MSTIAVNSITDAAGGSTAQINGATPTVYNTMGRNRIINGGMDVWQRGTSVSANSSSITYTVDRFAARPNSSTATTVSRSTSAPEGFSYSALITRNSGQTGTLTRFQTALETINMASLRGQVVTLSFYAKADSGYTTASSSLPVFLYVGNGTERLRAITSYDNQTTPINDSVTLTTSWQRFTLTSTTLPSDLSQLTVAFEPVWSGTAPSNDGFYITGVQLEVGSVATEFERRPYGTELSLCQRYFWQISTGGGASGNYHRFAVGSCTGGVGNDGVLQLPVRMRIAPSLTTTGTASDYASYSGGTVRACSSEPTLQNNTTWEVLVVSYSVASGQTQGFGSQLLSNNNQTSYFKLSAEL